MRLHEQQFDPAIVNHVRKPFCRISQIERHIGAARFQDRELRDQHRRRTGRCNADPNLRSDAFADQACGEAIGALVQFTVTQLLVAADQGYRIWLGRRVRFK